MSGEATHSDHASGKDARYRVLEVAPFNGGLEPARLADHAVTPVAGFFCRNHAAVPAGDGTGWRLEVGGLVERPLTLSLAELGDGRFRARTVVATLVCAGLRRRELLQVRDIPGELPWGLEPVSTAEWTGVLLADVLAAAGPRPPARHVEGIGADEIERHGRCFGFGGSVPLSKALGSEVLLAWEMNGAPLPALHGGPLRLVVPGYIGARSVKWLTRLRLGAESSENYFQREAYRVATEVRGGNPRDVRHGDALGEVPLNAVILEPTPGATVPAGTLLVVGWAMGQGGAPLDRVEISPDGGRHWLAAELAGPSDEFAWRFWRAEIPVAAGPLELVARAWELSGRGMPAGLDEVWNLKGYANNAWHRVPVVVRP